MTFWFSHKCPLIGKIASSWFFSHWLHVFGYNLHIILCAKKHLMHSLSVRFHMVYKRGGKAMRAFSMTYGAHNFTSLLFSPTPCPYAPWTVKLHLHSVLEQSHYIYTSLGHSDREGWLDLQPSLNMDIYIYQFVNEMWFKLTWYVWSKHAFVTLVLIIKILPAQVQKWKLD